MLELSKHGGLKSEVQRLLACKVRIDINVVIKFDMYGPRMHSSDDRVVSNFIVHAIRGDDISICGDGWQSRSI